MFHLGLQSNEQNVTFIPVCELLYRHSLQSELRMPYMENMSVCSRPSISDFYQIWYTSSLQKVVTQMWVSWKSAVKTCFTYGYNCNAAFICYTFHPIWIKYGTGEAHKNLVKYYQFSENQCIESHSIFWGINVFTYVPYTIIIQYGWNSVQRMWT